MRSEWVLGVCNVLGLACFVGGPEVASIEMSAVLGAGCLLTGIGVILVESFREFLNETEKENGAG